MRVLVTGGLGFIGTNLIQRLLEDGHDVDCLDNYSSGKREHEQEGCNYIEVDVSDSLRRHQGFGLETYQLKRPDIIYHLSAETQIPTSFKNPRKHIQNNYISLLNVLDWSRQNNKIPIVFAGSASRYGNVYDNPYAFSKYQGEELCKLYSDLYKIPNIICRFFNVYGPFAPTQGQYVGVIGIFSRLFEEKKPLTITGDGTQTRDFINVKDIVNGLVSGGNRLLSDIRISDMTFDLGTGKSYSLNEIAKSFGEEYPIEYISERQGEIKHSICDPKKTKQVLGWETKIDVIDYIKNTYIYG